MMIKNHLLINTSNNLLIVHDSQYQQRPFSSSALTPTPTINQCLDFLITGNPEDWIYNTTIISYHNQLTVWIHKPYLEISLKALLFLIIIIISVIGNYLIVIVIVKFKNSRNCTNLFICNMAIADLLTTIMFAWPSLIENSYQNYLLGPFFCKIESSAKVFFLISGVFSLSWISCDRLIGIIKPFRNPMKKKRALAVIAFIWLLSLIIATPAYFWRFHRTRQWCDYLEVYCKLDSSKLDVYMFIILAICVYVPLFLIACSYCLVLVKMKEYEDRISSKNNIVKIRHRRKIILMFFIYLISSAICWSPLQAVVFHRCIVQRSSGSIKAWSAEVKFWAQLIASANSAVNPIIYGITNGSFRKAICLLYPSLSWILTHNRSTKHRPQVIQPHHQQKTIEPYNGSVKATSFTVSHFKRKHLQHKLQTISGHHV